MQRNNSTRLNVGCIQANLNISISVLWFVEHQTLYFSLLSRQLQKWLKPLSIHLEMRTPRRVLYLHNTIWKNMRNNERTSLSRSQLT